MLAGVDVAVPWAVPVENTYCPCSRDGGAVASISPCTTPSVATSKLTVTFFVCPACRLTRVNPTSRFVGTSTGLIGCDVYTGTTTSPVRVPVFDTESCTDTVLALVVTLTTEAAVGEYERPYPNG